MPCSVFRPIALCAVLALLQTQASPERNESVSAGDKNASLAAEDGNVSSAPLWQERNKSLAAQEGNESIPAWTPTPGEPFNCHAPHPEGWSSNHSDWCCEHERRGCRFDCMHAYNTRETDWSVTKQAWCCEQRKLGCEGLALSEQPYDCQKTYWERAQWSPQQQEWCCYHRQLGCFPQTTAPVAGHQQPQQQPQQQQQQQSTSASAGAPATEQSQSTTTPPATHNTTSGEPVAVTTTTSSSAAQGAQDGDGTASVAAENSSVACLEDQTTWEPLDMPGTLGSQAANASECQQRCARTTGCVHFSFWWLGNNCHLQDAYAVKQTARLGFVSGPFRCWEDVNQSKYLQKDNGTFVSQEFKCAELGAIYSPLMGLVKHFPSEESGDALEAVKKCRAYCTETEGCAHFTVVFPQRLCSLSGTGATKLEGNQGAVSGTPSCWGGVEHQQEDQKAQVADDAELKVIMKTSLRAGALAWQQAGGATHSTTLLLFAVLTLLAGAIVLAKRAAGTRTHRVLPQPVE